MARSKQLPLTENVRELEQRKRNKINIRHTSPSGKHRGAKAWLKTRHRVRKKMLR